MDLSAGAKQPPASMVGIIWAIVRTFVDDVDAGTSGS